MTTIKATLAIALSFFVLFANATGIRYQATSDGVSITLIGVDAPNGPPPEGALHCLTGTRSNWAGRNGAEVFDLNRMIGGCGLPDAKGNITHMVRAGAVNNRGVLCLIPLWTDQNGRRLDWSAHPDGDTNKTARSGGMITALKLDGANWRAATAAEAHTCD